MILAIKKNSLLIIENIGVWGIFSWTFAIKLNTAIAVFLPLIQFLGVLLGMILSILSIRKIIKDKKNGN